MNRRIGVRIARTAHAVAAAVAIAALAALMPASPFELPARAAEPGAATPADVDPAAAIAAAHRTLDEDLRKAILSPFTAVAAHYIESGRTVRLEADERGVSLDPASNASLTATDAVMAAVTYTGDAFWVAPVSGAAAPAVRGTTENGDAAPGPGTEVKEKRAVAADEVIGLGRFFLEMSPQSGMGRVLIYDPDSPMKKAFTGLKWFDPDPALQVKATFRPHPAPDRITIGTSRGLKKEYFRAGTFEFTAGGTPQTLTALSVSEKPSPGETFFVPFRDATTGKETYEVGRYLSVRYEGAGAAHVIDFNTATNPNCNYSPHYNCPIPPKENTLTVSIRAGEKTYPSH